MLNALLTIIKYDIRVTIRQAYSWLTPLLFFIIAISLFPLAISPDKVLLKQIAPGIIWVTALLSILISIDHLFKNDASQGYLDLFLLSTHSLPMLVLSKILSYWLTHCLPLIIISPLFSALFNLEKQEEITLIVTLLLGTPILCLLGAIGAALIVGIRQSGLLLPILIMPLYIPVLIFATAALLATSYHQPVTAYYAILAALLLFSLVLSPLITSMALRIGANQ
jgi:heme exporter protein B